MPNPGKPLEKKKLIGSRNYKEPTGVIEIIRNGTPEPIRRLEESGLHLWNETWAMGDAWISDKTDVHLLQITCEQLDERDILRLYVIENIEAWHERAALRQLENAISSNLSMLGFTPTDRSKLGFTLAKTKSKLQELLERND
jgi:hypothetical protein